MLLDAGRRVITYDRRGFGKSSQPSFGYDYDTFAADLNALMDDARPARRDPRRALDGHGRGDPVPRHLRLSAGQQGGPRLADPAVPAPDRRQPRGAARQPLRRLHEGRAAADAPAWMKGFLDNFYNIDVLGGTLVSDEAYRASWNIAPARRPSPAVACIPTWETDFRADLPKIDVPMLVIQGDADRILPFPKTGKRLPGTDQGHGARRHRRRPARDRVDPRRPGQPRAAGLPQVAAPPAPIGLPGSHRSGPRRLGG